jgi:hypothetical protein
MPKRFPVGAKYVVEGHVVEGRGGDHGDLRVLARYVVLPDGRRINVPADLNRQASPRALMRRRNPAPSSNPKVPASQSRSGRGRRKFAGG